ncbi:MAG TPA: hypothetical protein VG164_03920 [Trebonia sp.]|jgi:hypothetical protein|nr:hypothetical protein [Trebonia sp.]
MAGLISRFLAAIGAGRRKAEADVSYDPALTDNTDGGKPGQGGSDLGGGPRPDAPDAPGAPGQDGPRTLPEDVP